MLDEEWKEWSILYLTIWNIKKMKCNQWRRIWSSQTYSVFLNSDIFYLRKGQIFSWNESLPWTTGSLLALLPYFSLALPCFSLALLPLIFLHCSRIHLSTVFILRNCMFGTIHIRIIYSEQEIYTFKFDTFNFGKSCIIDKAKMFRI